VLKKVYEKVYEKVKLKTYSSRCFL